LVLFYYQGGTHLFARTSGRSTLMQLQLIFDPSTEDFMKDLKADWRKWTVAERCVAASFVLVMSGTVSALYFLSLG
jgi:hypothetical protein